MSCWGLVAGPHNTEAVCGGGGGYSAPPLWRPDGTLCASRARDNEAGKVEARFFTTFRAWWLRNFCDTVRHVIFASEWCMNAYAWGGGGSPWVPMR